MLGLLSQRLGHPRLPGPRLCSPWSPRRLHLEGPQAFQTGRVTYGDPPSLAVSKTPCTRPLVIKNWPPPALTVCTHLLLSQSVPHPWPHPVTLDCGEEPITVASSGILSPGPAAPRPPPPPSLPPGDTRDSLDGLAPVAPQSLPDGLHVHLERGEAELLEEGAVVGILAGSGHEEVMHCNDSVRGLSPPGSAPLLRPPPAFPEVRGSSVHTSIGTIIPSRQTVT